MSASYFIKDLDNQNYPEALSIISSLGFFYSLNQQNLILIKSRVFSSEASNYPITLRLLTLAIVIINNVKLEVKEQKMCVEYLTETLKTSTYKQICAGLLVRLPNFQNKHTVLSHLHPSAIPLNLMVDIASEIKKNKPSALERQLLKYRTEWALLLNGFEFSMEGLKQILNEYKELKEGTEYQLMKNIESEVSFLVLRIRSMYSQKINLDRFCQTIESMIEAEDNEKLLSQFSVPICRLLQCSAYNLLNEMILKLEKKFVRKYQWLVRIMQYAVKTLPEYADLTLKILSLVNTIQKVFGNGALETESIIFSSKSALIVLLENLLVESDNNKHFSMQTPTMNHNKSKNISELSVKKADNPYPEFVKNINKKQKQELITAILKIIISYFKEPHDSTHLVRLSDILDEHEHKLSFSNKQLYEDIKLLIFPRSIVYSPGLEQVYQQIILGGALDSFIKRRKIDIPIPREQIKQKQPLKESYGMKLIESKHNPHSVAQSNYFSCNDNNSLNNTQRSILNQNRQSMNQLFYSCQGDDQIFKTCKQIHKNIESFDDDQDQKHQKQQCSNYVSFDNTPQIDKNINKQQVLNVKLTQMKTSEGRACNPIQIIDEDSENSSQVIFT